MADRTRLELATSAGTGQSSKNKTLIDIVFASVFNFSSIVYTPLYMLNTLKYGHKKGTVDVEKSKTHLNHNFFLYWVSFFIKLDLL